MHRRLLTFALLACAAPSADAGCKGLFKQRGTCGEASGHVQRFRLFEKHKATSQGPAPAAVNVGAVLTAPARAAVGVLQWAAPCANGQCSRVSIRVKAK